MAPPPGIPVLARRADAVVAWRGGEPVRAGDFLATLLRLAETLPEGGHCLNLLRDRYLFTAAFAAALVRGGVNLLPPNPKPEVQRRLAADHPGTYVVHDGLPLADGLPDIRVDDPAAENPRDGASRIAAPGIAADHVAAISFTSGSTGRSAPIPKTWRMFRGAVDIYARDLIRPGANVVATVPSQHMYGLELTSLLALWYDVAFTPEKPLLPADVAAALHRVPAPRVLVTTPLHLRAVLESGVKLPGLARILCATAPLDAALAAAAEAATGAEVLDVYGCSEAGCIGFRRLAQEARWRPHREFRFAADGEGRTRVDAPHLDTPVVLQDRVRVEADGRFRLEGRLGDMVKVAGKRGSLSEMTRLLLEVPGVRDGLVFDPGTGEDTQRPAAIYEGGATRADIRRHMGAQLDAVLIPRPIIQVDRLPRTDTSKLPRERLLDIYRRHRARP